MFDIDFTNETITGLSTPDPLRYAFSKKTSAHAAGGVFPIRGDMQEAVTDALASCGSVNNNRCIYIHIPFCRVRCTYCNFFQNASSKTLVDRYFAALMQELEWKAKTVWAQSAPFQAVYVGGGTPSDLSSEQLTQLGNKIRELFPLAQDCEMTLEGRLNRLSDEKFEHALAGGFNRFSFGVQSFNTEVRKAARRLDDRETVFRTIERLTSYNAAPIVVDLLFGLPGQDLSVWQDDLESYLQCGADGVDLYQLIEMPGMPMQEKIAQGKLPPAATSQFKATMFEMGVNFMARHHQKRLSVNHWASSNRERSVYNSLAKTSAEVLPVGAGSGGTVNGIQLMQYRKLEDYLDAIENHRIPVGMAFRQLPSAVLYAELKAGMDHGVLSRQALNKTAGKPLFEALMPLFDVWQKHGLVTIEEHYVVLTLAGQFWSVNLAQAAISVLETNAPSPMAGGHPGGRPAMGHPGGGHPGNAEPHGPHGRPVDAGK